MLNYIGWERSNHLNGSHSHSPERFDDNIPTGVMGISMVTQATITASEDIVHPQPIQYPQSHNQSPLIMPNDFHIMDQQLFELKAKVDRLEKQLASSNGKSSLANHNCGAHALGEKVVTLERRIEPVEVRIVRLEQRVTRLSQPVMTEPIERQFKRPLANNIGRSRQQDFWSNQLGASSNESLRIPETPPELVHSERPLENAAFGSGFGFDSTHLWMDHLNDPFPKAQVPTTICPENMHLDLGESHFGTSTATGTTIWPTMDDINPTA
jgi:hypothetical protein